MAWLAPLLVSLAAPPLAAPGAELIGARLASVRIDAPADEIERLERYLEIRPGDRLQPEAVRHAVELIHATGRYQDVIVDAVAESEGVALVLRPVRAPLLDRILREGDGVLKPGTIARLTRLAPGEPLWPARLERAARELALVLVDRGYLEATVTPEARRRDGVADAVFQVRAGPLARVRDVQIEAGESGLQALLRPLARPYPGGVFRRAQARRAAERMRDALVERGHWRASVEALEAYDPGTGRVDLTFLAAPGARFELEFEGSPLPGRGMQGEIERRIRDGRAQADALDEASERIEEALRRLGHRLARVAVREEDRGERHAVVYAVEAGPQAFLASARVSGDAPDDLEALLDLRPGEPLEERRIVDTARRFQRALEDRGHSEARVEPEVPEGGGHLHVVFRVRAGPLTRVASIDVEGALSLSKDVEPRELRLRAGAPYRVADLGRDRNTLLSAYRDGGYPQVEVVADTRFNGDRSAVEVVLRVTPGPRVDVDHVVVAGLSHTREEVVRRELALKTGEPLGLQKVLESQRRLGALGIFRRVSVTELDPETPDRRSVLVVAEEAPATIVSYGLGYAERDKLRGSVEVTRRNLFGLDRSLTGFARVSFAGSRFLVTYQEPRLFGRRQSLFLTGYREEEDRLAFDFERAGALVQTVHKLLPNLGLILRYTYQETDTFNVVDPDQVGREFTSYTLSGPSASLVNDTRDDPLDPRRGHFVSADLLLSQRFLGGDAFAKAFVQAAGYRRLDARSVLALSGRVGVGRSYETDPLDPEQSLLLPRPERFYAGGDYSLRGFGVDQVRPVGGNGLLLAGAELRIDLARSFSTALFGETGNVYRRVTDMSLEDLRYTAGLGLRYRSALGPIRLDWGYKLDRRTGEKPYEIHFTVGHAF